VGGGSLDSNKVVLADVRDPRGKRIRITQAQWQHLVKNRKGFTVQQVVAAISRPDCICVDRHAPAVHECYYAKGLLAVKSYLKVIVEKERLWRPGRLRTAHATSTIHPQDQVTWTKP